MEFNNLLVEIHDGIATVTVNRPKALNALNQETVQELLTVFEAMEEDSHVAAVILTGSGEKAFAAGGDIAFMMNLEPLAAREFALLGQKVFKTIENLSKPVIAAVNGYALGGGCELAMACDIRLASENAKFGQPEVNLGVIPGFAGTQRLPRLVGKGRAKELLFTGDIITATEAYRIGLVNKVVDPSDLPSAAMQVAKKIAAKGPLSVRFCKEAVNFGLEMDSDKAAAFEADLFALCFSTEDRVEGMRAFLEKRPAEFNGR